jgi:ribosomal protein S18 acetylase RimI-like enzyme
VRGSSIEIREAHCEDLSSIMEMLTDLRKLAGHTQPGRGELPVGLDLEGRITELLALPDHRLLVAVCAGERIGMVLLSVAVVSPLYEFRAAHITYLHVRTAHRRRGAGRALLTAAVAYAEDSGADHLVVDAHPQSREENRFYARLGFGPLVVRRATTTGSLRRRLATTGRSSGADDLLARRRSLRRLRPTIAGSPRGRGPTP